MWAQAQPGLALDSTWFATRTPWRPLSIAAFDSTSRETSDDVTFELLGIRSPNGAYTLNVDSYQVIQPDGDTLVVGGEPDSRCSLIDNRSLREATLDFCGTACAFNWGVWLTDSAFAVGGWRDADDSGERKQARLSIYSIADSSVSEYAGPSVSGQAYRRYLAAWEHWLLMRYRMLKPKRGA